MRTETLQYDIYYGAFVKHAMSNKEFNHRTDTVKTLTLWGNYRHQKETEPHQISHQLRLLSSTQLNTLT